MVVFTNHAVPMERLLCIVHAFRRELSPVITCMSALNDHLFGLIKKEEKRVLRVVVLSVGSLPGGKVEYIFDK